MSGPCTDCGGPDYQTLVARVAALEAENQAIVANVAEGKLDGYRELAQKLNRAEAERDKKDLSYREAATRAVDAEAERDALRAVKDAAEELAAMASASWLDEAQEAARQVERLARESERVVDDGRCPTCGKPAHPKHYLGACGPVSTWPSRGDG